MTHEERLDRLERIAKLMVRAGLRARRQMREQDEKIDILIAAQMRNEEILTAHAEARSKAAAETDEKINILIDSQIRNDEKINILIDSQIQNEERFASLARAQERTEVGLNSLRETVERFVNESRSGQP